VFRLFVIYIGLPPVGYCFGNYHFLPLGLDVLGRHVVFSQELGEIVFFYPVVSAGQAERLKLAGGDPSEHGGITDAAALGDESDGDILRAPLMG
jgi:hypothetical protein